MEQLEFGDSPELLLGDRRLGPLIPAHIDISHCDPWTAEMVGMGRIIPQRRSGARPTGSGMTVWLVEGACLWCGRGATN